MSCASFPHYSTFHTDLTPTEVNLLASLTAWCIASDPNKELVLSMYQG